MNACSKQYCSIPEKRKNRNAGWICVKNGTGSSLVEGKTSVIMHFILSSEIHNAVFCKKKMTEIWKCLISNNLPKLWVLLSSH